MFSSEQNQNELSGAEQKVNEYVERIDKGESLESVMQGLPSTFRDAIEKKLFAKEQQKNDGFEQKELAVIPPQYEGLDAESLDFIWDVKEYMDPEKTVQEKERKAKALAYLREKEEIINKKEESSLSAQEDAEQIKKGLGISTMENFEVKEKDAFSEFRMKNGETDAGFFWNEYRNNKAKELKNTGQFEWGKERIYFDVSIQDCEKLRDIAFKVASEKKIPIAFKYIDNEKTFPVHKDGKETRFVANFVSSDDARAFYEALAQTAEYQTLVPDRSLDYKGIRIDGLAEYASGFREIKGALERIMSAHLTESGAYEYIAESGKKMVISKDSYEAFKGQYEKLQEAVAEEKKKWFLEKTQQA